MFEVKNRLEKFLISLSGALLVVVFVFGFKIKSDNLEKEKIKKESEADLSNDITSDSDVRKKIEADQEAMMSDSASEEQTIETIAPVVERPSTPPTVAEIKKSDTKTKTS